MNQNPQTQDKPARYEPRDPHFYMHALCKLAAALVPATASPQYHQHDHLDAENAARQAARLLDGGGAPDGFLQRAISRRMAEVREFAATVGVLIDSRSYPVGAPRSVGTAAEVQRAREKEALREKEEGPMPTLDELRAQNEKDLDLFRDLSEPVRWAALDASATRLRGTDEITGARIPEALGIVCEEILRAIHFAEEAGVPTRGLSENAGMKEIAIGCPYPANLAALAFVGAMDDRDEEEAEPQTARPKHEGP